MLLYTVNFKWLISYKYKWNKVKKLTFSVGGVTNPVGAVTWALGPVGLFIPRVFAQVSAKGIISNQKIPPKKTRISCLIGFLSLRPGPLKLQGPNSEVFVRNKKLTTHELLLWPVQSLWVRARPRCRHCEASKGQQCYQSPQQRINLFWNLESLHLVYVTGKVTSVSLKQEKVPSPLAPKKAAIFFQSSFFRAVKLLGGVASKGWLGSSISNFTRLHGIYQVAPENP